MSKVWNKGGKANTLRETRGGVSAGISDDVLYEKDSRVNSWTEATEYTEATGYTEASRPSSTSRAQSSTSRAQSSNQSMASDDRESMGWSGTESKDEVPSDMVLGGHSRFGKNDNGKWKATQSTRKNFVPTAFCRVTLAVGALGFGGISKTDKTERDHFKSVQP